MFDRITGGNKAELKEKVNLQASFPYSSFFNAFANRWPPFQLTLKFYHPKGGKTEAQKKSGQNRSPFLHIAFHSGLVLK